VFLQQEPEGAARKGISRMKLVWKLIRYLPLVVASLAIWELAQSAYRTGVAFGIVDPVRLAEYRLYAAGTGEFVDQIETAIAEQDYAYATALYDLGLRYGHDLPPDLRERAEANWAQRAYVYGSRGARGFVFGSVDSGAEIAGSLTSDLIGVGDLRDFSIQGFNYAAGRDYDPLLLGLSAVGIGLTAASYSTAGAAALPDAGMSLIKNAYRTRKLSRPMTAYFSKAANRVVDGKVLKTELAAMADEGAVGLGRLEKVAAKALDGKAARSLLDDAEVLTDIGRKGGMRSSVAALSLADGPKDLRKLQRAANHFGENSYVVFKFLGRSVLRVGYGLYAMLSALASLAMILIVALIRLPTRLVVRLLVRRLELGEGAMQAVRPLMRLW